MKQKIFLPEWSLETFIQGMVDNHMPLATFSYIYDKGWDENLLMKLASTEHRYQNEVIELIKKANIEDLDLNYLSFHGMASYHLAVLNGKCELAEALFEKLMMNDKLIDLTQDSSSILHLAIMSQNLEMIKLVEKYDNNYLQVDLMEKTSLGLALINFSDSQMFEYVANQYDIGYLKNFIKNHYLDASVDNPHNSIHFSLQAKDILEAICEKKQLELNIENKDFIYKNKLKV
jgi:hypothetical protein